MHPSRRVHAVILSSSILLASIPSFANDVEQHLRDKYLHKTFILRSFYSGNSLHYDATGSLLDAAKIGAWTVDGVVQVEDIGVDRDHITIRASRIYLGWFGKEGLGELHDEDRNGQPDKNEKKSRTLKIKADFPPGELNEQSADAVLSHIFLTEADSLAEALPDYWRPCVRAATGVADQTFGNSALKCYFSAELLLVPGVAPAAAYSTDSQNNDTTKIDSNVPQAFRPGRGVSPPKLISNRNPEFSEAARAAKFQGVVTLGLIVDQSGQPTHIRIVSPIGGGLDEQAVHAVSQWKFQPAQKDGEPVAAQIAVEVDFHLY